MNRARRGHRGLTFGVAVVTTLALAGGIAYATIPGTGNVFSACMLKGIGTIRLIDKSLPSTNLMSRCTDKEIEVSWNQAGQPGPAGPQGAKGDPGAPGTNGTNGTDGEDGVSVTTASEPGGANCAAGGIQLTAANGASYVCNGKAGVDGKDGTNGTNGADGAPGADGADGVDGKDGVSVMSSVEPAGGNCANGGSKFTAANGLTYACNGAPGTGGGGWSLSGNAGTDSATEYLGTSDQQPFELRVNGLRVLRLEPGTDTFIAPPKPPNLVGGGSMNGVGTAVSGGTIGGGGSSRFTYEANRVVSNWGTVGGGVSNVTGRATGGGTAATVGGGSSNTASGQYAAVGGGLENTASGYSAGVAGGGGNIASGELSFVAGGNTNIASGHGSFAAGTFAKASHFGSFVWADRRVIFDANNAFVHFESAAPQEFAARATGGVRFVSGVDSSGNTTAGVSLAGGSGSWSSLSDRTLKRNFASVDGRWVLERLAGLPITTWSYKAQKPSIRHLGPTAQDFRRAFGLGVDSRHIDSIDSEGVSLAGIKALYELAQRQQREITALKTRVAKLERSRDSGAH